MKRSEQTLSENQMVSYIRNTPKVSKLFDKLSPQGKRRFLVEAEGDTWRIADILRDILETERIKQND